MKRLNIAGVLVFLALRSVALGELSKDKINTDLHALVEKRQFDDVEKYIATNQIHELMTNLLFKAFIQVSRRDSSGALENLKQYVQESQNQAKAYEEALRMASDLPDVEAKLRAFGEKTLKLKPPTKLEVEKRLRELLTGENADEIVAQLDANRALIESNPDTAYQEIRSASLRFLTRAGKPEHPTLNPKSVKHGHARSSEKIFRYLETVNRDKFASLEGQCQLANILQTAGDYGGALQILDGIRELAQKDHDRYPATIDIITAGCLYEMGVRDRAKELYRKILEKRSDPHYAPFEAVAVNQLKLMDLFSGSSIERSKGESKNFQRFAAIAIALAAVIALALVLRRKRVGFAAGSVFVGIAVLSGFGSGGSAFAEEIRRTLVVLTNTIDLGKLRGLDSKFQWIPEIPREDAVVKVYTSCGCTAVGIKEGERLIPKHPIPMSLALTGKNAGSHEESVSLELASGDRLLLRFRFEYHPVPRVVTRYLLFWPGSSSRKVSILTYNLKNPEARILDGKSPVRIKGKKVTAEGLELECEWIGGGLRKGEVVIEISAGGKYTNSVPFVTLEHAP
jgi:tetratricopeptide (TPR) repeat protein